MNTTKKMKVNCRLWWPKQLSSSSLKPDDSTSFILLGWFLPSPSSFDFVVVPTLLSSGPDNISVTNQLDLQGILHSVNEKMSQFLQEKSTFSILGLCVPDRGFHNSSPVANTITSSNASQTDSQDSCEECKDRWTCGCLKVDGFLEEYRGSSVKDGIWIQLSHHSVESVFKSICWAPMVHHIHWGGQLVPNSDVHFQVIFYDPPVFGAHHFSLRLRGSSVHVRKQLKSPMWVDELHKKESLLDLESVIFAVNSATSAKIVIEGYLAPISCFSQFFLLSRLVSSTCHLTAMFLASFFTFVYIILQLFHGLLCYGSQMTLYAVIARLFRHTWKNTYTRSCQLLYWPVHLQDNGFRSQSNVEYAHRWALHKHSMWSSVAVDVLLGNCVGFALLLHIDSISPLVLNFIHDVTNNWLRLGCVWLMGDPAGFKLNSELAGILGIISLNAIQIWSTLWIYLGFLFRYFMGGLALTGIIAGMTILSSLVIDMTIIATSLVSALHWLISLVYSHQIKSLAALWRLFRGRKWNPLRQRFDSYNYTVKQHVLGSLLFTPLLLLLPTTSVFYIFFTIMNSTIRLLCIVIEVTISVIHATPYHEIFLWVIRPGRFPNGIWFDGVSSQSSITLCSPVNGCLGEDASTKILQQRKMEKENISDILILFLRTNYASLGQIILPHYMTAFQGVSLFTGSSSASGFLTGSRFQSVLPSSFPSTMPWMYIAWKEYWYLCYDAVLSCLGRSKQ